MFSKLKGISRSAGAKRFIRGLWFYKHFVPPGPKTERLFLIDSHARAVSYQLVVIAIKTTALVCQLQAALSELERGPRGGNARIRRH